MFVLIKTESVAGRSKRIRDDVFSKVLVFAGGKFLCVWFNSKFEVMKRKQKLRERERDTNINEMEFVS